MCVTLRQTANHPKSNKLLISCAQHPVEGTWLLTTHLFAMSAKGPAIDLQGDSRKMNMKLSDGPKLLHFLLGCFERNAFILQYSSCQIQQNHWNKSGVFNLSLTFEQL